MNHMKTSVTIGLEIPSCLYAFFHQQYDQFWKERCKCVCDDGLSINLLGGCLFDLSDDGTCACHRLPIMMSTWWWLTPLTAAGAMVVPWVANVSARWWGMLWWVSRIWRWVQKENTELWWLQVGCRSFLYEIILVSGCGWKTWSMLPALLWDDVQLEEFHEIYIYPILSTCGWSTSIRLMFIVNVV